MPVERLHESVPLFCRKFTLVPAIAAGNDHPARRNDFNLTASWAASELDQIFENSDGKLLTLAKDVLALTKVNWNATQFDQKLPAPVNAAREVGRILKHIDFGAPVSPDFRKYT